MDHDSDLERETASSSGWPPNCRRSHSPPKRMVQPERLAFPRQAKGESEALGDAAGCLVSGIYLVSARGAMSKLAHEIEQIERSEPICQDPVQVEEKPSDNSPDMPWDAKGQSAQEQPVEPSGSEDLDVPSGAFVLETPRKYRIGRPPCMFGRSHVNILAHPDRFRFWFDRRCGPSPLAFALCSQAASGYRNQLNRLLSDASHTARPGFMVLTGRWNKRQDSDVPDWKLDSPQHKHHALEDSPFECAIGL